MTRTTVSRSINAPIDLVFKAISDIGQFPDVAPDVLKVEFLSATQSGIGTRFRETRMMNGKESVTELEVTEYRENDYVRMVADSHGTIWDTIFKVSTVQGQTDLQLTMDARPHKLLPRIMNPILKGLFKKGLEKHMDAVKVYCEK